MNSEHYHPKVRGPLSFLNPPERKALIPEEKLMMNVLLGAVHDYFRDLGAGRKGLRNRALFYFYSPDKQYIFSFGFICDHFGFDKTSTRNKIMKTSYAQYRENIRKERYYSKIK